ncbi:hypothetical protein RB619_04500 [Flavobacterium sp. LHD-80]|uniref:hypothetical protein n=1 Tax=unclassified Flavobacterium TaxID=196869 RepID=UPI0027E1B0A5|nr:MULTISPECIES: hypothetical protein [unclassified Flavobacterium]MDQ6469896.1 hypothetical protein [Flavobacterium sp. LHD-80]MDQ6531926.1 hypothetical protein [Flavobacterium sp. LHD-85]
MKKINNYKTSVNMQKKIEIQSVQKMKKRDYIKLFLILFGIALIFAFFFSKMDKKRKNEHNLIKSDYKVTKGIITKKFVYKGSTISVKFKIGDTIYEGSDALDIGKDKKVGDSLLIKYYPKDPNLFITEVNSEWEN